MNSLLNNTLIENVKLSNNEFNKHYHDTYTIGLTYSGVIKLHYMKKSIESYKYSIRVNNPSDVHGGEAKQWSHSNFYPTVELISNLYEDIYDEKKVPFFENFIINDKVLFFKLHNFFNSYFKEEDTLVIESNLIDAASYLITNHTISTKKYKNIYDDKKIIKETYNFINDSIEMNFSLDILASNVNLSKYHFLRIFKKQFGLTPYDFILNERVNRASSLIQKGLSISEASYTVGFTDQSHFSKNCKKFFNHTPSYLQKNSNIFL